MGVDVDPAREDVEARGVDFAPAAILDMPHFGDHALVDGDVGVDRAGAGAVDHRAAPDHEIVHRASIAP